MGEGSKRRRATRSQNPSLDSEDEEEARRVKEEIADDLNGEPAEDDDDEEVVVEDEEVVIPSDDEEDGGGGGGADDFVPRTLEEALVPRVGTVFDSVDEAFALYKAYAYRTGFHAVRRTCHNYEGLRYRSTFTCTYGGKSRAGAAPSDVPGARYPLRSKRGAAVQEKKSRRGAAEKTGCKAMLIIRDKRVDDRWKVESVELEHNHPCTPDMVRFLKAYREMPESAKKKAKITNEMDEMVEKSLSEIAETRKFPTRPKKGASGGAAVGSHHRVSRTESFVQRFGEDDLTALKKFIETMQHKKPNFIHSWDLDRESRVKNFFWTDSRAQAQYRYFGDVITLDVIYLQHSRASLPLATLLGVNNHGHLVLLGCGLLSGDNKENYLWFLKRWLSCMNGKPPEAITTSYSDVIAEAVAEVFPNARHRFCFWHILKKLLENVGRTHEKEAISSRFKEVVYDSVTLTDFEKEWGAMVDQYNLKDNEWFSALYNCRKQWAPGYVNHSFWAGTSAIRKVEKPDPYFDGVVTKTTLPVFLEQYETTLKGKLEREAYDDLRSYYSRLTLLSGLPFEEQLVEIYTVTMFQAFQDEIKQLMHVICKEVDRSGSSITYMVSELIQGKKVDYTVVYNNSDKDVWCICRSFPSRGILCSHALAVLKQENVLMLPSKYILNRWRKDFRILTSSANTNCTESDRNLGIYDDLYFRGHEYFEDVIDIGAREPELKEFVLSAMKEAKDRLIRPDHTQQGDHRVDVNMTVTGPVSTDTRVDVNMASHTSSLIQGDRRVDVNMTSNAPALVPGDTMTSNATALIHRDRRMEMKMPPTHLIHGEGRVDMNMTSPHLMQRERRVDMNMASPHLIQGDRRVDMNLASPHFIHSDRRVDMNLASPHLMHGDRRVDMNMASPHLIQGDTRVDMNMVSTSQNGMHTFDLVNVNLESGSLPMAATDFMQMHPHPPVYHPKQLLDMRDQVMDANKRPNMETNTYFMGGGMHVG
ncbi:protein FAR1-RELATED SEQUENCE 6-like [Panicum virgatum]|uniref:protein FAR1-RELATED SEQUENCE 6-like n=1 Tax=Panicum virgatum TaxID=38727 RepID=UPI0019D5F7F0|nr:protein FAR1-RELATED SEQUENCE 6-like [Panicum virgatum]XP_039786880.1 protein FAR1-RELATED SEQUENCE 6-like [Panicum virgatum]XP_039786881.1 protein FAR1-RELATED SEQUENCE 6-like [Panicum virgatum]XP_039786883.1 protein FAR1-RELATED SEQUENCE 6-like [Panicum virgatum]XP_039786884.1 protein FAR1-RELATED SEQUENCE 6-like [Panicum virgatum]